MTDTAAKLASASSYNTFEEYIIPDGTLGQDDWQTISNCYGGILAGALAVIDACYVNLKGTIVSAVNLKAVMASSANFKDVLRDSYNLRDTVRTTFNFKSDVC